MPGSNRPAEWALIPLDSWISYRFGLIAARLGGIGESVYAPRHRLTTSAWRVLAVVARFEPCSASELASHSRLNGPKVSRAIDVLVERTLLVRKKDPEDQRRAVLTLTAKGRRTYEDVAETVSCYERALVAGLSEAERASLWRIVAKLEAGLDTLIGSSGSAGLRKVP